jgi:hypothetical protein
MKKIRIRIRDEQPGLYFRDHKKQFFGLKYLNSLMWIRDPQHCFYVSASKTKSQTRDPHDSLSAPRPCLNMLLQRCAAPLLLPAVEAGVLVLGVRSAHVLPRQRKGDQGLAKGAGLLHLPLTQLLHPPHLQQLGLGSVGSVNHV